MNTYCIEAFYAQINTVSAKKMMYLMYPLTQKSYALL